MNIPESLVCPSCESTVKPLRRKVPTANLKNVAPILEFGWFCPIDQCGVRLEKAIAALQNDCSESDESIDPNDIPEDILPRAIEESPKSERKPTKVRPNQPAKKPEDLFAQIREEHERAVREERELTERLATVRENREKLDRLILAMDGMQPPIAAE